MPYVCTGAGNDKVYPDAAVVAPPTDVGVHDSIQQVGFGIYLTPIHPSGGAINKAQIRLVYCMSFAQYQRRVCSTEKRSQLRSATAAKSHYGH
ncbi:hypothetical protein ACLKA6_000098 [Drosophila palustris]